MSQIGAFIVGVKSHNIISFTDFDQTWQEYIPVLYMHKLKEIVVGGGRRDALANYEINWYPGKNSQYSKNINS